METLTGREWSEAIETMLRAADSASRLGRYISNSLPITDESNRLYRDAMELATEMWQAYDYLASLDFSEQGTVYTADQRKEISR